MKTNQIEQVCHCLVTDILIMTNPDSIFGKPSEAFENVVKKGTIINVYSMEVVKIALLMTDSVNSASKVHSKMTTFNSQPLRGWLFHVSKCPRCLLVLSRKNAKHCFGDGLEMPISDKYEELFENINALKCHQSDPKWPTSYLHKWYRVREQPLKLKSYEVEKENEIIQCKEKDLLLKIKKYCEVIKKNGWEIEDDGTEVLSILDQETLEREETT